MNPVRKSCLQFVQLGAHGFRNIQRIGARLLDNLNKSREFTVHLGIDQISLFAHRRASDVFQPDNRTAVIAGANDHVFIIFRVLVWGTGNGGIGLLDACRSRFTADLTGRKELVLGRYRFGNISRRDFK